MEMSRYVRLTCGLNDKGKLIDPTELGQYVGSKVDYYSSIYYYNDRQYEQFKKNGTVSGINDVTTDKLVFDFDSEVNPNLALNDTREIVNRLSEAHVEDNAIQIYFSGNKGFHVVVELDRQLTPEQAKNLAVVKYGSGLKTLDSKVYNPTRIFRLAGTQHPQTSLYKIPLTIDQLYNESITSIRDKAKELPERDFNWTVATLPEEFYALPKKEEKPKLEIPKDLDLTRKPVGWKDYKYAILQGFFKPGERHNALLVLAATCRAMGYDKETAYYMCKSALYKSQERFGEGSTNKGELWQNIIEQTIFKDTWNGGQFAPVKEDTSINGWLYEYCERLGFNTNQKEDGNIMPISDLVNSFENYAANIDNNTIRTGIEMLDERVRITIGSSISIVGAPGSGKTSLALQVLNNLSKQGLKSIFFSYDMYYATVLQKLVQKHFNISQEELFSKFKENDTEFKSQIRSMMSEEYGNVDFCFRNGQTVNDVIDTIKESEQKSGEKVKLVVMDYNELIVSDFNDSTASSNFISQKMREIANTFDLTVIGLFQPNKMTGDPSDEIKSYRSMKGGSGIEQAASCILGISRPGFNPDYPDEDKFMKIRCLKNRMGSLFSLELFWNGLQGTIREMSPEESLLLAQVRARKAAENEEDSSGW